MPRYVSIVRGESRLDAAVTARTHFALRTIVPRILRSALGLRERGMVRHDKLEPVIRSVFDVPDLSIQAVR